MKENINLCESCKNNRIDIKSGILCNLTGLKPSIKDSCQDYLFNPESKPKEKFYTNNSQKHNIRNTLFKKSVESHNLRGYIRERFWYSIFLLANSVLLVILLYVTINSFMNNEVSVKSIIASILWIIIVISTIYYLSRLNTIINDREKDPLVKYLSKFGKYEKLCEKIIDEMEVNSQRVGNMMVTSNWLMNKSRKNVWFKRIEDVVWCYHSETLVNSFRTSAEIVICDKYGEKNELSCSRKNTNLIISIIKNIKPDIVVGYHKSLENIWSEHPLDFIYIITNSKEIIKNINK